MLRDKSTTIVQVCEFDINCFVKPPLDTGHRLTFDSKCDLDLEVWDINIPRCTTSPAVKYLIINHMALSLSLSPHKRLG